MCQKHLTARLCQDPLGKLTMLTQTHSWIYGVGVRTWEKEGEKIGGEMGREEWVTGEEQVGWEGREGRKGEGEAGNLAYTIISKSQCLC